MPLQLLLLQIPLWDGERNLTDGNWRDANIDTLHLWHPCFFEIFPESVKLLYQYYLLMERYKNILLETSADPVDELACHVTEEASMWFMEAMNKINYFVWED